MGTWGFSEISATFGVHQSYIVDDALFSEEDL
jgi:hypothetical protein